MTITFAHLRRAWRELGAAVLVELCPPHCAGCGELPDRGAPLCAACRSALRPRGQPACARFGAPVVDGTARCRGDHDHLRNVAFARAPFRYAGTGGELVRRPKFRHDFAAGVFLARNMARALEPWARGPGRRAALISVPLHRRKRRARGFDQAALLAEEVARELRLSYVPGALARVADTLPQGDPRVTSRDGNVASAFGARRPLARRGRTVVLVDDVRTSGATGRACARVLRERGARAVALLTAAWAARE